MDSHSSESNENLVEQLRSLLRNSEDQISKLQQEKLEMRTDFEDKKKKVKDLFLAKDNAIKELNTKLLESGQQISTFELTIENLKEEIENIKMIASVSENTKAEAVEDLNKQHQDEIESLRCVLQKSMEEQRIDLIAQFEQERRHWEKEKLALEEKCNEAKKLNAKIIKSSQSKPEEVVLENDQLGLTMEAAQSEAEALKAVVMPLEAEIAELKRRLALSEVSLEKEKQKFPQKKSEIAEVQSDSLDLTRRNNFNDDCRVEKTSDRKAVAEPFSSIQKSTDSDSLNLIDVLSEQNLVLQRENDTLKTEMHEVCRSLEQEICRTNKLEKTSRERYLNLQLHHSRNMELIEQTVGKVQWKKLEEVLKNKVSEPVDNDNEHIEANLITIQDTDSQDDFQPYQCHSSAKPTLLSPTTALDNISVSSLPSQPASVIQEPSSPQKVLSAPHLATLEYENNSEPHRVPETKAWDEIPAEASMPASLSKKKHKKTGNLTSECSNLKEELLKEQNLLAEEKRLRSELESELSQLSERTRKRICELSEKLDQLEKKLEEDRSWRKRKETEDDKRLNCLQKDREQIYMDYLKVKKENDNVKTYYEKHRIDLANQPITSTSAEDLYKQVHRLREALLAAQVERNHIESVLQSQLSFAQDSLKAEQVAKEQLESALMTDLDSSRKQVQSLQQAVKKLENKVSLKKDLETQLEKARAMYDTVRTKSNGIILDLKEKLRAEKTSKEELENNLHESKNQVRSLQDALETSEQVQKDFVRLSQSLQMELEEIRLREEEKALADQKSSESNSGSESSFNLKPG